MEKEFSVKGPLFDLYLGSRNFYDITCLAWANFFEMPSSVGKYARVDTKKEKNRMKMNMKFSLSSKSFTVDIDVDGADDIRNYLHSHSPTKAGSPSAYESLLDLAVIGDNSLLPFVADCLNLTFYEAMRVTGNKQLYIDMQPFFSDIRKKANPIFVDWLNPLLKEQREFVMNPTLGVDKDVIPLLKSVSDFSSTSDSCAGGFHFLNLGEHPGALARGKKVHNPEEFFHDKELLNSLANGGYLIPGELYISGITDSGGVSKLQDVHDEMKKDYAMIFEHAIESDIAPFKIGVISYPYKIKSKINGGAISVYSVKIPASLHITSQMREDIVSLTKKGSVSPLLVETVKALFKPYEDARERLTTLLE